MGYALRGSETVLMSPGVMAPSWGRDAHAVGNRSCRERRLAGLEPLLQPSRMSLHVPVMSPRVAGWDTQATQTRRTTLIG
jgi:hypothetical protein